MNATRLHLLTERLSSLMRAELRKVAAAHKLRLVQLEALIYLSVANRYSDTPMALTEYFGVTKGTVSQTLKALERRGLIEKWDDPDDRRQQRCSLTDDGKTIVRKAFPSSSFKDAGDEQMERLADVLEEQLRMLQRSTGFKTFGQCHTCRFYQSRGRTGRCGLTDESLTRADATKICREHALPSIA